MAKHEDTWLGRRREDFQTGRVAELAELLASGLRGIDERLGLEVDEDDGGHEAIITAGGDPEAFALVDEIVASAPAIPGWTFVALHPARGFGFEVRAGGLAFDATALTFMPLPGPDGVLGVRLLVPNPDAPEWPELAPMVIQTGLGERVAARLDRVEVGARPDSSEHVFALEMLASYVSRHAPPLGSDLE